ncbi:MAG: hypothetical protein ABGY24_01925 [bacterium]
MSGNVGRKRPERESKEGIAEGERRRSGREAGGLGPSARHDVDVVDVCGSD